MSLGSPAEILPFTRSLTCRQRLQRIAVMTGTVVTPPSTDVSIRRESPDTSNDHGRVGTEYTGDRPRVCHKARLLDALARRFELWRQRHAQLSRELRDQPYLLPPLTSP